MTRLVNVAIEGQFPCILLHERFEAFKLAVLMSLSLRKGTYVDIASSAW